MRTATLVTTSSALGVVSLPALADVLYDNGPVNGINGYSNATSGVFGFSRFLLDDFQVPAGGWTLREFHWNSVWATPMGGTMGFGVILSFRADNGGRPGAHIEFANVTQYSEAFTGNIYFSREEVTHWAEFDDIFLPAGQYWFEAAVQGPENNFWLTADLNFSECWVNYDDDPFGPGSSVFGVPSDINFILGGVPVPGALALLGLAAVTRMRRRF